MKKTGTLHRAAAAALALTMGTPSPAWGLRAAQPESPGRRAGLEEALRPAAGLEEVILQPGQVDYERIFRPGREVLDILAGEEDSIAGLVESLPPGQRILLRVRPADPVERGEWTGQDIGLVPLGGRALQDHLVNWMVWPPHVVLLETKEMSNQNRDRLEVALRNPFVFPGTPGYEITGAVLCPAEVYSFQSAGFPEGLQADMKELALPSGGRPRQISQDQVEARLKSALATGRLMVLDEPLGLPDDAAVARFAAATGLPADRFVSEAEWGEERRRRAEEEERAKERAREAETAKEQAVRVERIAESIGPEAERAREALRGEFLQQLEPLRRFLDSRELERLEDAIGRFTAREIAPELAGAGLAGSGEEDLPGEVRRREEDLRQRILGLPGRPLDIGPDRREEAARLAGALAEECPEIIEPEGKERVKFLAWLISDSSVRRCGWTPARLLFFIRGARSARALLERRLPEFPFFEKVEFVADPSEEKEDIVSLNFSAAKPGQMALRLNVGASSWPASDILAAGQFLFLQMAGNQIIAADPDFQKRVRKKVRSPELGGGGITDSNAMRVVIFLEQVELVVRGMSEAGHPWVEAPPLPFSGDPAVDGILQSLWEGGYPLPVTTWSAKDTLAACLAFRIGGEVVTGTVPVFLDRTLQAVEKRITDGAGEGVHFTRDVEAGLQREGFKRARGLAGDPILKTVAQLADKVAERMAETVTSKPGVARPLNDYSRWISTKIGDLAALASLRALLEIIQSPEKIERIERVERAARRISGEMEQIRQAAQNTGLHHILISPDPAVYRLAVEGYTGLVRDARIPRMRAGLEEQTREDPVSRLFSEVAREVTGWSAGTVSPRLFEGTSPGGTRHFVALFGGGSFEDATMISVAIPPDWSRLFVRGRAGGELTLDYASALGPGTDVSRLGASVRSILEGGIRSKIGEHVKREEGSPSEEAARRVARQEQAIAGWPTVGQSSGIVVLPGPPSDSTAPAALWEWSTRLLSILELLDDPQALQNAVSEQLARYGPTPENVERSLRTLDAYRVFLARLRAEGGASSPDAIRGAGDILLGDEILTRLTALAGRPSMQQAITRPYFAERLCLQAAARVTAGDPRVRDLHRRILDRHQRLLRALWAAPTGAVAGPLWWERSWETTSEGPLAAPRRRLPTGRYHLAAADLSWEGLLKEMESLESSEEVPADLGEGERILSLAGLRTRLWDDVSTWDGEFTLSYEVDGFPLEGLRARVSRTPRVVVNPVGEAAGIFGEDPAPVRAGTAGSFRRAVAARIPDAERRAHFLALPAGEVIDIARPGDGPEPEVSESTPLREGDHLYVALPPLPAPGEDLAGPAAALYRTEVRGLFEDLFVSGSRRTENPADWGLFLGAVGRLDPEGYESLKRIGVPETHVVHADLLRHRRTGAGVLVTGDPAAGKSVLCAMLAGDPRQGWSEPLEGSHWEYLANDTVLLIRERDRLLAGLLPMKRPLGHLTTRVPLEGAVRVPSDPGDEIYRTEIMERWQWVPLRGIVWLNQEPADAGGYGLERILGQTDPGSIRRWSDPFRALVGELKIQEHIVVGPELRTEPYRNVAEKVGRWAGRLKPQGEESAGLEETLLLQPGQADYQKIFRPGRPVLEAIAGEADSLSEYLEGLPAGQRVILRVVPGDAVERREWIDPVIGLLPLSGRPLGEELIPSMVWPPQVTLLEPADLSDRDRDRLVFGLDPPYGGPEMEGARMEQAVLVPREVYSFRSTVFSDGLQSDLQALADEPRTGRPAGVSQKSMESRLRAALKSDQVVLLNEPLGLPDEAAVARFAGATGLPADRFVPEAEWGEEHRRRVEEEKQIRLEAETVERDQKRRRTVTSLAAEVARAADLESLVDGLSREFQSMRSRMGEMLDGEDLARLEQEIAGLNAAAEAERLVPRVGEPPADIVRQAAQALQSRADRIQQEIRALPARPIRNAGALSAAVRGLLEQFPELHRPEHEEAERFYRSIFRSRSARANGWTPALAGLCLLEARRAGRRVSERFPGFAGFDSVMLISGEKGEEPMRVPFNIVMTRTGRRSKRSLAVNLSDRSGNASQLLGSAPHLLLQVACHSVLLDDPVIQESLFGRPASRGDVEGAERIERPPLALEESMPAGTVFHQAGHGGGATDRLRRVSGGLTPETQPPHPWVEAPAFSAGAEIPASVSEDILTGGLGGVGLQWGSLFDLINERLVLLVGDERSEAALWRSLDETLSAIETYFDRLETPAQMEERLDKERDIIGRRMRGRMGDATDPGVLRDENERFIGALIDHEKEPRWGEGQAYYRIARRSGQNVGILSSLLGAQALLESSSRPQEERLSRVERLAERLFEEVASFNRLFSSPLSVQNVGMPVRGMHAAMLEGYRGVVQGVRIAAPRTGLEEGFGATLLERGRVEVSGLTYTAAGNRQEMIPMEDPLISGLVRGGILGPGAERVILRFGASSGTVSPAPGRRLFTQLPLSVLPTGLDGSRVERVSYEREAARRSLAGITGSDVLFLDAGSVSEEEMWGLLPEGARPLIVRISGADAARLTAAAEIDALILEAERHPDRAVSVVAIQESLDHKAAVLTAA